MINLGTNIGGRYLIERRLGRGGFAVVYLARDQVLEREVAIKVIMPDEASVEESEAKEGSSELGARLLELLSEARFIAKHHHPNILDVYDFGQAGDEAYIVMPYAAGGTLLQKLRNVQRFSLSQTGRYLEQLAAGLDYAHNLGVIHRDIKPQNILLFNEDQLVIADFGLAKVLTDTEAFSNTRASGTPSYMAPEQFRGKVSRASDVYSLGVVIYQMLTGQLPFTAPSQAEMMFAHINTPPPPLRRFRPDAPPALEQLLLKVLAKEPAERPATAGQFAQLYRLALEHPDDLSLPTLPIVAENTQVSAPQSGVDLHDASTHAPAPASATQVGAASESASIDYAPVRRNRTPKTAAPPVWLQYGLPALGALAIFIVLMVFIYLNFLAPKPVNPNGNISIALVEPTNTPRPTRTATAPATTSLSGTATTIAATATIIATETPNASATETPAPPTATATSAPQPEAPSGSQQQPNNNPAQSSSGSPVQPLDRQPQPAATSTPVPQPTPTFTPVPPTATATPIPPTATPTPCPISTRRGFGQVYSSRPEVAQKLGCAAEVERQATLAYQPFKNGFMLYIQATDQIYVFYGVNGQGNWQRFNNTFRFSDPTPTPFASGCAVNPINGFNKLWVENAEVRSKLGCAVQVENSSNGGATQRFTGGTMYFYPNATNGQRIYVIYNDGAFLDLPDSFVG
jgi:serine/threonine protein kinase